MSTLTKEELKDYIKDSDELEPLVASCKCVDIAAILREQDVKFNNVDLVAAVLDLQKATV